MSAVMMQEETVLLRADADGITTLTLNRPTQFNSLSEALLAALQGPTRARRLCSSCSAAAPG